MMINNVVSFLPTYISEAEWSGDYRLTSGDVSQILAIFSIAQIIFAPLNGSIKNRLGAKNTIIVGFILLTATTFGLGLIAQIKNAQAFKYTACALRFF